VYFTGPLDSSLTLYNERVFVSLCKPENKQGAIKPDRATREVRVSVFCGCRWLWSCLRAGAYGGHTFSMFSRTCTSNNSLDALGVGLPAAAGSGFGRRGGENTPWETFLQPTLRSSSTASYWDETKFVGVLYLKPTNPWQNTYFVQQCTITSPNLNKQTRINTIYVKQEC